MRTDKIAEIENIRIDYGFDYKEMNNIIDKVLSLIIIIDIKEYLEITCESYTNKMLYDEYLSQLPEEYLDDILEELKLIIE